MAHVRSPYTLFARKLKTGKVWYFQTYDESGRRRAARSTGKRTKGEAIQYCQALIKEDRITAPSCPTLEAWVKERHWFEWENDQAKPKCLYALGKLARSPEEEPAVQKRYIQECGVRLETYILPDFGKTRLNKIFPADLERWMFKLSETLAGKTVNNIASAFRIMMAEAYRLRIIPDDPWTRVPSFKASSAIRGSLDTKEAIKLLNPATIQTVWQGHRLYYLVSLTGMLTGCRQSEILAIRRENLHEDHIDIVQAWKVKQKEAGPTKAKTRLPVAIPRYLYDALTEFCVWDGFVFSFNGGRRPASGNRTTEAFNEALTKIGISEEERMARGITFHGWRKFCNTYLRGKGIPDAKVRAQTRHASPEMTEHYTAWNPSDFKDVQDALGTLVTGITKAANAGTGGEA